MGATTNNYVHYLLEDEFVAQFKLLIDDYTPSTIKAINMFNEADNRRGCVTVSQSQKISSALNLSKDYL